MNLAPVATRKRPELLAPAKDLDCVRAAVENGADAVYFGLDAGFNARARATNISLDVLDELIDSLHRREVKGYVALNTLVFTDELAQERRSSAAWPAPGSTRSWCKTWVWCN